MKQFDDERAKRVTGFENMLWLRFRMLKTNM